MAWLLHRAHVDLGMLVEIVIKRSGSRFGRTNDKRLGTILAISGKENTTLLVSQYLERFLSEGAETRKPTRRHCEQRGTANG